MGLFTSRTKKHQALVLEAAKSTLSEADRTYRNHVALFSERFRSAEVSGMGLMKARLFNVCFPVCAFILRWEGKPESDIVLSALSTLAVQPLLQPGAIPSVTISEDVRDTGLKFISGMIKLIVQELNEGPSQPAMSQDIHATLSKCSPAEVGELAAKLGFNQGDHRGIREMIQRGPTQGHVTTAFVAIKETCHSTLEESVGAANYTNDARREFDPIFTGNIFTSLRGMSDLVSAMK